MSINNDGERDMSMEAPSSGNHRSVEGTQNPTGLVFRVTKNPADEDPIFQVRSEAGAVRLFADHEGWTGSTSNSAWFGGSVRPNYFRTKVGVGTSTPTQALDVVGTIKGTKVEADNLTAALVVGSTVKADKLTILPIERSTLIEAPRAANHRGSGEQPATGVAIRVGANPPNGAPIFQVQSSSGAVRLFAEHEGWTGSTSNSAWFGGTRDNFIKGRLGVGTETPEYKVDVKGWLRAEKVFSTNGELTASDLRMKTQVEPLQTSARDLSTLHAVRFKWADPDAHGDEAHVGLIAQEVERVFPELVATTPSGMKAVNYAGLVAPLIEMVKQQEARLAELERRLAEPAAEPS